MIKVSARNGISGEEVTEFMFPSSLKEIGLNRYVDFFCEVRRMSYSNPYLHMANAVAAWAGISQSDVTSLAIKGEGMEKLYAYAMKCASGWKPSVIDSDGGISFEHKGETFHIKNHLRPEADMTVAEAIEAFETVRIYGEVIEKAATVTELALSYDGTEGSRRLLMNAIPDKTMEPGDTNAIIQKYGDPDGNGTYSRYLLLLAIFARRAGETLPVGEIERKQFLADRAVFFEGVDANSALCADFFLHSMFTASGKTPVFTGSLIRQHIEAVVEMSVQRGKHTIVPSRHKRKSSKRRVGGR